MCRSPSVTIATCRSVQFLPARSFTIHRCLEIKGHHLLETMCVCVRDGREMGESVRALPHLFRLTESVALSDLLMDMERESTEKSGGRKMGEGEKQAAF